MNKQIIIVGNVIDGFQHFGPFNTPDEALEVAEEEFSGRTWVICDIIALHVEKEPQESPSGVSYTEDEFVEKFGDMTVYLGRIEDGLMEFHNFIEEDEVPTFRLEIYVEITPSAVMPIGDKMTVSELFQLLPIYAFYFSD